MKKIIITIIFLTIFRSFIPSFNKNFKIVKIIGDDQDGCIFSTISDAILTPSKDIFILDGKESFIAKYDWEGNFINRVGQKGQGPGDFYWPTSINIFNGKVYFLDRFNNRFVEADLELKNFNYFKFPPEIRIPSIFTVIDKNKFVIDYNSFNKPDNDKICIIEKKAKINTRIKRLFFNHTPIDIQSISKDNRTLSRLRFLFEIFYALDDKSKKLLITFKNPDNPIVFFLYSINGELLKRFSYKMDKKYHFTHTLYKEKKLSISSLKGQYAVDVDSVFYYDKHWYIFVAQYHYKTGNYEFKLSNHKNYVETKSFYLKFDENGKLIGKFITDPYFRCFYISKDGYALGKHPNLELEQLMIYKILK
jgi:hypothetical protein